MVLATYGLLAVLVIAFGVTVMTNRRLAERVLTPRRGNRAVSERDLRILQPAVGVVAIVSGLATIAIALSKLP